MKKKRSTNKRQIFKIDIHNERIRAVIQSVHGNVQLLSFSKFKIYHRFMSVNEKTHSSYFYLQNAFRAESRL